MGMLEGRVAICTGAARGVGAEVAKLMAAHGAKIVVVDPGVGGAGEGGDQRAGAGYRRRDQGGGRRGGRQFRLGRQIRRLPPDGQPGARQLRRAAYRVQRRRHPARQDVPQHVPGGLAGRHRRASDRPFQCQPGGDQPVPRAELRPADHGVVDLGPPGQCRPDQLRLGQDGGRRARRESSRWKTSRAASPPMSSRRRPTPG